MTLQKAAELPEPPLQEIPFQVYKTEARRRGAELLTGGEIFGFFLSFHEGEKCFSHPTKPSEGGTKETVRKYQGCLQEGDAGVSLPVNNLCALTGPAIKMGRAEMSEFFREPG